MRPEERRAAERAARKAAELRAAAVERSRVEQRARAAEEARRSAAVVKARAQTSAEEAERARLERARERARARRADEERARRRQDDLRSQLRALNRERAADEERARSTRAAARARLIAAERDRVVEERQGAERRICEPSPSLEAERAESSRRAAAAERRQAQREAERAESSRRAAAAGRRQAQREAERAESNRRGAAVGRRRAERDAARVESSRQASDADRRQAQREAERRAETLASIRATVRADRAESARAATRAEEQRAQLRDARLDEAKKAQEAVQRQERARARQKKQAGPAPKPPPPPKPKAQPRARTGVLSAYLPWLTVSKGLVVNDRQRKVFLRGVTIRGLEQPRRNPTARPPLTEADVGELGAWGANAIVVPLAQDLILFGQGDVAGDDYLAAVDLTVQTAAEAGMYTILQLEKLAASVPQPYVPDSAHLQSPFPDPGSKGFWGTVARRYATEPAVLFDVFAAPHDPLPSDPTRVIADAITWSFWTSWLLALVGEIRLVHPRSLVIVRGLRRGTDLSGLPLRYTNRKQVPNIVHAASVRGSAYVPMLQRIAALRKSGAAAVVSPWTAEVPGSATLEVLGQRLARSNLHWIVGGWRVGDSPLVEEVQGRLRPTALGRAYRRAFAAPRGPAANLVQPVSERPADVIAEYLNEAQAAEASVSPAGPLTAGERALVRTALPLADRPEDVAALVFLSRAGRRPGRRLALSTKVATGLRDVDDDELAKKDAVVVESLLANMAGELADYERLLAAEWRQVLGLGVQDVWRSFLPLYDPERRNALALKPPERQQPVAFVRYRSLRPAYCRLGYSRPFEQIFSPLVRGSFFGRPVLVQPRVNAMLAQLPAELEARVMPWLAPGHPGGFVPRFIAGTTTLSDHAFGLALDFNPATNPHIKGGLIPVVRWGTRGAPDAPDGYEFGSPLVDENAVPDRATRVAQIHATGRRASDRFARWLRETIAKDDDLALLEKGELALIEGWKRMLVQPAHIAFRDLAEAGLVAAQARLAQIQAAIALSGDLQQLRALRGIARPAEIATWRDTGIRDMPLELPAAMTAVGFVWGDEWRGHKDGMHFDLGPVEKVLVPDAPRRRLEDLLAV